MECCIADEVWKKNGFSTLLEQDVIKPFMRTSQYVYFNNMAAIYQNGQFCVVLDFGVFQYSPIDLFIVKTFLSPVSFFSTKYFFSK